MSATPEEPIVAEKMETTETTVMVTEVIKSDGTQISETIETVTVSETTEPEKMEVDKKESLAQEEAESEDKEKGSEEEERRDIVDDKTPPQRGRPRRPRAATTPKTPTITATALKRGRKRKGDEPETPAKISKTPGKKIINSDKLSWETFAEARVVGERVLSCGEGDQLGHPGRSTTKKPRKIDIVEEENLKVVQAVAGGVHSLLLTEDGQVYTCGINEKGTCPGEGVEMDGSTDEFVPIKFSEEIQKEGKIVQLTAGASFSAALTDLGSVIAWGNLRDSSGMIDVHPLLHKMKECPVVVVHHKSRVMVKIAAGENHLAMLSEDGELLTFGDGSMGQLGRSVRTGLIRSKYMCDESGRSLVVTVTDPAVKGKKLLHFKDVHAAGFWTMVTAEDGRVFAFGLNNFGHLGIPVQEADGEKAADGAEDERELRVLRPAFAPAFEGHEWTAMEGVQHVVARDRNGDLYGIGKNTDNALGLGTWTGNSDQEHWKYDTLQKIGLSNTAGVTAKLGSSIAWTKDGDAYAWGCDTSGQLGLGLKDDDEKETTNELNSKQLLENYKVVDKPEKISSAHLDGYKITSVSIADNHALFIAKKV